MRRTKAQPTADKLSVQEMTVVLGIWDGLQIKGVADRMGLSHKTIKNYMANIFEKLSVRTQVQLVRKALELGLLQVPEAARGWRRNDMEVPG